MSDWLYTLNKVTISALFNRFNSFNFFNFFNKKDQPPVAIGSSLPTASRAAVKFFILRLLIVTHSLKLAARPRRSVPHSRRRHGRRQNCFFQSCKRRGTGVCGDASAALDSARQKSLVRSEVRPFARERGNSKSPARFNTRCRALVCFPNIFIRSPPAAGSAAMRVHEWLCCSRARAPSGTKFATAAEQRAPNSIL